jgi:multiple sugar transport system permease protein
VFVLPSALLVVGLMILPGVYALTRSTYDWSPGYPSDFVGLDNFRELFRSETFREILHNQAVLLLGVPLWTVLPLSVAFVLHERVPAGGLFRTIFFFPAILSPAIVGILFRSILAPEGFFNETLRAAGLGAVARPWIDDSSLVKPTLIAVFAWASLGLGVVIFSSALSAVPLDQLESARIDGAGWWRRLRWIVFPAVRPTVVLWAFFQVIGLFLFSFGWIFVLTLGGPGVSSTTIDFDIYQNALNYGFFGLAAAESVVLFAIVVGLLVGAFLFARLGRRLAR